MKNAKLLLAFSALAACVDAPTTPDDPAAVAQSIEQPNGGLTTTDEAPLFGDSAGFDDAQIEQAADYSDPYASLTYAAPPQITHVVLVWGQLPPDLDAHAVDWSGSLAVSRGALIVRRTIGFEPATDAILPRTDPTTVAFTSITRPFVDGLVLDVADPDPTSTDPLTLTYTRHADGSVHAIALADLLGGPQIRVVDSQGDKVVAIAHRRDDACAQLGSTARPSRGFGRGRWRALDDGHGRMLGEITDAHGQLIGHLRGIWGVRRDGEHVFFGKYIDRDGAFQGLFAGHYADGELRGHWLDRSGEVGRLQGRYDANAPGALVGGDFLLRWAETSCAADIPQDSDGV